MIASWWTIFSALIVLLTYLFYKYTSRNYDYWEKRNVDYVKPAPFLGSILPVLSMKSSIGEWLWDLYKSIKQDYFGLFVFDQPVLVVSSPKIIKLILQKDFSYFEDRTAVTDTSDPVMQNLLFFSKGREWRSARAKISPVFTSGKLKAMFKLIMMENEEMLRYLSTKANVPNVEAKEICAKYSTNVIARCAYAIDAGSFKNEDAELRTSTALRQFGCWFAPSIIKFFRIQFFPKNLLDSAKKVFTDVLQIRETSHHQNSADLIDILLETNRKHGDNFFTPDAMLGHAIQFFAAGFETVSSTMSYALYEMAINLDMQDRLRKEIQSFIARDGDITYSGIQDMKYMDMVVSETLRKYPVLPFLDRMCKADYKVEGTDLVIEKGMPVYIPMFGLSYDPKYFPDPEKFDPERFADKSKINVDGMYYFPFGEGPRICIGERFGLLGVKTGLAMVLSNFRVGKSDKTPIKIEFEAKSLVLQSKVGVPMIFTPL